MDKNEILEKSRRENNDEYNKAIAKNALVFSTFVIDIACLVMMITDFALTRQISIIYVAIIAAAQFGISLYQVIKVKNKKQLAVMLLSLGGFALCFAAHISEILV